MRVDILYEDRTVYTGSVNSKGEPSGKGAMFFRDGSSYTGRWKDNFANGKGTMRYSDGSVYVGQWVNNKREGKGEFFCYDGTYYRGAWKDDTPHGRGKITLPCGRTARRKK